jgi:tRNA(Arg) A34 adenosine deaminase TadA
MVAAVLFDELFSPETTWKKRAAICIFCVGALVVTGIAGIRCWNKGQRDLMIGEMFTAIVSSSICFLWSSYQEVEEEEEEDDDDDEEEEAEKEE